MKFIYHKQENVIREAAIIKEPKMDASKLPVDTAKHYSAMDKYEKYQNHIIALKTIPCHPSCKTLWEDGTEREEGRDYTLETDYISDGNIASNSNDITIVHPITQESEDELWHEVSDIVMKNYNEKNYIYRMLVDLKSKFTINKK